MNSTQAMRDRIRELMTDPIDDYDRAVLCVLDDLEHMLNEPQPTPEMVSDLVAGLKYVAEFPINNSQRQHAQQVLGKFASQVSRPEHS